MVVAPIGAVRVVDNALPYLERAPELAQQNQSGVPSTQQLLPATADRLQQQSVAITSPDQGARANSEESFGDRGSDSSGERGRYLDSRA